MATIRPVPSILTESPAWFLQAVCADPKIDPDLFFNDSDTARQICGRCPVRNDCLSYAMASEIDTGSQLIGVWGGLSPIQRKRLRAHPERLDRMRRVRSRTKLRLLPTPAVLEPVIAARPVQLTIAL